MSRKIFQLSLALFLCMTTAFAQVGKVSGTIVDKQSKEPLIGANVQLVGTTIGASSDVNGRYVIFNVPPGTYDIRASYVGYQNVTVDNVRITSGLTQEVNFELSEVAIQVQPVTIIAQRPLIEKSATNAIRIIRSEDLDKLPLRGMQAAIALQPGVVLQNDRIHIRGSRPTEVGYQVEGANTRNIVGGISGLTGGGAGGRVNTNDEGGGSFASPIPEAVEEILIQAGGYNAEFGGANAGIVQQNLKTGREDYHVMFQAETDNFSKEGKQFLGTYSYGYSDYVLSLSGPVVTDKVRFFLSGRNGFIRDYNPTFWEGANFGFLKDTGKRGGNLGDSALVRWDTGNIKGRSSNLYQIDGTLLLDYNPLVVKLAGEAKLQRTRANGLSADVNVPQIIPLQTILDLDRLPQIDQSYGLVTAKGTYFFNPTTFGEMNVSFQDQRLKQYDPNFEDNLLAYGDSIEAAKRGWQYRSYSDPPRPYDFFGFPFSRPGAPLTGFSKNQVNSVSITANFTTQQRKHEIRAGGSYEYYTVRNYAGLGAGELPELLSAMRNQPDVARSEVELRRLIRKETFLDNYGFDEFGKKIDSGPDGPKHPKFGSFYIQDKVEFSDLIINAGLRYDYINMNTWKIRDPNRPGLDEAEFLITADSLLEGSTFSYLEPRLGLSFPVTDRTVFHLQYGQFVQAPPLFTAYRGRANAALIYIGQFYITNPVAYDIQPTRTTQYEIGFTQQFSDFASFDLTGFYKDIKGELQYDQFYVDRTISNVQNYPVYINADFATTKGLEFRLTVRRVNRVQAQLNYTLSDARGTNSFPASAAASLNVAGIRPTNVTPLGYDQTHRGSINVDYRFAKGDGGPILEQLGVNLLFTFNSGHHFTRAIGGGGQQGPETGALLNDGDSRSRTPIEAINTSVTPWNFNLDLRMDKTISLDKVNLNVYFYIQNLLNTKNITNVYYRSGNAFDDGYLTNPALSEKVVEGLGPTYVDLYRAINLANRQHQWALNGLDLFSTPRQIRFGVRVEL